jgi:threonine/homoserine/homoserine lactone efflux protein
MPDPSTLLVFALAALALIAVPGPNLIYIATRSVGEGRGAGLASALGVETGTLLHIAAAAVASRP